MQRPGAACQRHNSGYQLPTQRVIFVWLGSQSSPQSQLLGAGQAVLCLFVEICFNYYCGDKPKFLTHTGIEEP